MQEFSLNNIGTLHVVRRTNDFCCFPIFGFCLKISSRCLGCTGSGFLSTTDTAAGGESKDATDRPTVCVRAYNNGAPQKKVGGVFTTRTAPAARGRGNREECSHTVVVCRTMCKSFTNSVHADGFMPAYRKKKKL